MEPNTCSLRPEQKRVIQIIGRYQDANPDDVGMLLKDLESETGFGLVRKLIPILDTLRKENNKLVIVENDVGKEYVKGPYDADDESFRDLVGRTFTTRLTDKGRELYVAGRTARHVEPARKIERRRMGGQNTIGGAGVTRRVSRTTSKPKAKPARDQVFICYSRKDKRRLDELQTHLKPYPSVTAWSDEQIAPGAEWFAEVRKALARTKVGVLLVTPDFLASDFIHKHELTPLLKEAKKGNVRIIWIPVRACSYKKTPLERDQAALDPAKPLMKMKKADRDEAWVRICGAIEKAVGP